MTLEEALQHFPTGYNLCKKLKITSTNVNIWRKNGFIPLKQQFLINRLVGIDMPIDLNKEEMYLRLSKSNSQQQ
jgi:hypothetical protein